MAFFARIWAGITQLFGLIIPFFAKATDFRGWGPGVRWFFRILFLAIILVVLYFINRWLDPVKMFGKAPTKLLGELFLPILFVLVMILSWLGWWLWTLLMPEAESSDFPDIDAAWDEARAAMNKQGLDITEVPLFVVLGRPAAPEDAMMQATQIPFMVRQTPRRPDAPLHVYANRDGIYVTCAGCSLTGKQAAILAGEDDSPLASADAGTPAVSVASGGDDGMKTIGKEEIMKTMGGTGGKSALQEIHGIMSRAAEQRRELTPAEKQRIRILSRKPRPALLKVTEEVERHTARLTHLCRLIVRDRRPYCPVNGIMILINLAATETEDDATQTGQICQQDLAIVRKVFQVNCPSFVALCDLETTSGFQEFIERFPEKRRQARVGQRFPLVPARLDKLPEMVEGAVGFICQTLFPTWVFKFFKVEAPGRDTTEATVKINTQLYRLMVEIRERQKPLSRILSRALISDADGPPLFGGCYLAATGKDTAKEQAFTAGVFRRLIDEQNFVSWTPEAIKEEADYQRWTKIGYIAVIVVAIVLVGLGWFLWGSK
jgi:hypothetical protein